MIALNLRRPADDPGFSSFLVIASAAILGLWAGEAFFAAKHGLRISVGQQQPWWYSLFFVVGAVAVWVRSDGRLFRTGVVLFALRYAIAVAEVTVLDANLPVSRLLLSIASAIVFFAAGWRAARPWARITSCIAFLVLSPVRYRALESMTGTRSVVGDVHTHSSSRALE